MLAIWEEDWLRTTVPPTAGPALVPPDGVAFLHDPLTVAALFPGAWLTLRDERLVYAVEDGLFRLRSAGDGRAARASVAVDGAAFEQFYVDRVVRFLEQRSGRAATTAGPLGALRRDPQRPDPGEGVCWR